MIKVNEMLALLLATHQKIIKSLIIFNVHLRKSSFMVVEIYYPNMPVQFVVETVGVLVTNFFAAWSTHFKHIYFN